MQHALALKNDVLSPDDAHPAGQLERQAPSICLVDDTAGAEALRATLAGLGYDVLDGLDEVNAGGCIAALVNSACDPEFAAAQRFSANVPVIMAAPDDGFGFRLQAARADVSAVLKSPVDTAELGAWLECFSRSRETDYSILIVEDDEIAASMYAMALETTGMRATVLSEPARVFEEISRISPDLVLLDLNMPDVSGIEVARIIRQSREHLSLPIVFLSAEKDDEKKRLAREIGGDDFIAKPVDLGRLADLVRMRVERAVSLRDVMERDSLTGLLNHARFKDRVAAEVDRSNRTDSPGTLCLLDIDHFKRVNDTYGHQVGDQVIQALARTLATSFRKTDVIARYGGEEFGILFLDTSVDAAEAIVDRLRERFASLEFSAGNQRFSVTVSAGLAAFPAGGDAGLISDADEALYEAKRTGRNRVVRAA